MKLISPIGVRLSISDDRGERLLTQGYRREDTPVSAPSPAQIDPHKPRRTRRKKIESEDSD